ncbi:MAG: hypothetical protein ACR2KX_06025 [Chitinophagaceae bacterium]
MNNMVADGSRSWGMVYWQVFVQPLILFSVLPKFQKACEQIDGLKLRPDPRFQPFIKRMNFIE